MDNNTRIVSYDDSPLDAGSLLAKYGISKHDITEDRRAELIFYFETMLTHCPSDTPGRFTENDVTVTFTGHDAAGNLLNQYN